MWKRRYLLLWERMWSWAKRPCFGRCTISLRRRYACYIFISLRKLVFRVSYWYWFYVSIFNLWKWKGIGFCIPFSELLRCFRCTCFVLFVHFLGLGEGRIGVCLIDGTLNCRFWVCLLVVMIKVILNWNDFRLICASICPETFPCLVLKNFFVVRSAFMVP